MASIAYITDRNMIEFHRLNGKPDDEFLGVPAIPQEIYGFQAG